MFTLCSCQKVLMIAGLGHWNGWNSGNWSPLTWCVIEKWADWPLLCSGWFCWPLNAPRRDLTATKWGANSIQVDCPNAIGYLAPVAIDVVHRSRNDVHITRLSMREWIVNRMRESDCTQNWKEWNQLSALHFIYKIFRMELKPFFVITKWSSTSIWSIFPASRKRFVSWISAVLGFKFPEGWLWARIKLFALLFKAIAKTSLKSTIVAFIPPLEMEPIDITLNWVSRNMALHSSSNSSCPWSQFSRKIL